MKNRIKLVGMFALGALLALGGSAISSPKAGAPTASAPRLSYVISRDPANGLEVDRVMVGSCTYLVATSAHGTSITPELNGLGAPACTPSAIDELNRR